LIVEIAKAVAKAERPIKFGGPRQIAHVALLKINRNAGSRRFRFCFVNEFAGEIDSRQLESTPTQFDRKPAVAARHINHFRSSRELQALFKKVGLGAVVFVTNGSAPKIQRHAVKKVFPPVLRHGSIRLMNRSTQL
jgi:hypothetical protein